MTLSSEIEKLEGPDREMDYAIFVATAAKEQANHWHPEEGNMFTSSIDAAMSLVPIAYSGCWFMIDTENKEAGVFGWKEPDYSIDVTAKNDNPAIALCAAALRSRGL